MGQDAGRPRERQALTLFTVVLLLFAVVLVLVGEYLLAGVTFLAVTFVIYLRETR